MKITSSKLILGATALAVACLFAIPAAEAAEKSKNKSASKSETAVEKSATGAEKSSKKSANKSDTAAEKEAAKKLQDEENLKKYDKNANGKLDPDERAAMRADKEKAKSEKGSKKKKKKDAQP